MQIENDNTKSGFRNAVQSSQDVSKETLKKCFYSTFLFRSKRRLTAPSLMCVFCTPNNSLSKYLVFMELKTHIVTKGHPAFVLFNFVL
jgi:hypothetical protein